jgi:hypothetical protein
MGTVTAEFLEVERARMNAPRALTIGRRVVVRMQGEYFGKRGRVVLIAKDPDGSVFVDVVLDDEGSRKGERVSFDRSFIEIDVSDFW